MKTIDLSDRVTIKQHSARVWKVLVDGSVVFVTHRGESRQVYREQDQNGKGREKKIAETSRNAEGTDSRSKMVPVGTRRKNAGK